MTTETTTPECEDCFGSRDPGRPAVVHGRVLCSACADLLATIDAAGEPS